MGKVSEFRRTGGYRFIAGCVPLVGVIGWFAFQQVARFDAIDRRLDRLESAITKLTEKVGLLTTTVAVLAADHSKSVEST